jgi:phosphopantetheine adenylyltransferase
MPFPELNKPCWLLLLPSPPSNISKRNFRAAYGPAMTLALRSASQVSSTSTPVTLDIALAYDHFSLQDSQEPKIAYSEVQKILGLMYTLICIISTEESIDVQCGNDVDTRALILGTGQIEDEETLGKNSGVQGQLIHIRALAFCRRPWIRIYFIESESGEAMLTEFLSVWKNAPQVPYKGLPGGASINESSSSGAALSKQHLHSHYSVAVGGTFDHLHAGHKLLLTIAALLVDFGGKTKCKKSITVGISGDALLKKKDYVSELLGWDARQTFVREFLLGFLEISQPFEKLKTSQRPSLDSDSRSILDEFESGLVIHYVELLDPFGPTVTDESISALVVSRETRAGGNAVNEKREGNGWPRLEIFEVDVLDVEGGADDGAAENFRGKISSTDIRRRLYERSAATS